MREARPLREKITACIRKRGLWYTLRSGVLYLARCGRYMGYDVLHGVSTRQRLPMSKLDLAGDAARYALPYEATDTSLLRKLLRGLPIDYSAFEFVDLGAGKGRTMCIAAEFPFRRIVGTELSPILSETARHNCLHFHSKIQVCKNLAVFCQDAAKFSFPKSPLVIYLFNPFDGVILSRTLENLEKSLNEFPREVFVVYHNSVHSDILEKSPSFDLFLSGADRWDYRKLPYRIFRTKPAARHRVVMEIPQFGAMTPAAKAVGWDA